MRIRSQAMTLKCIVVVLVFTGPLGVVFSQEKDDCKKPFLTEIKKNKSGIQEHIFSVIDDVVSSERRLPTKDDLVSQGVDEALLAKYYAYKSTPSTYKELIAVWSANSDAAETLRSKISKSISAKILKEGIETKALSGAVGYDEELFAALFPSQEMLIGKLIRHQEEFVSTLEKKLLDIYKGVAKKFDRTISEEEFVQFGEVADIGWVYGEWSGFLSFEDIEDRALKVHAGILKGIFNTAFFSPESRVRLQERLKTASRIIITSVDNGAEVPDWVLGSLETYAKANDAIVVVRPMNMVTVQLDEKLAKSEHVFVAVERIDLEPSLLVPEFKIMNKQLRQLTGTFRLGSPKQRIVFGGTHFEMESTATAHSKTFPRHAYTSGSMNFPDYNGPKLIQARTDALAKEQHTMGAVVLERVSKDAFAKDGDGPLFHMRHLEFIPEKEGFLDIGTLYTTESIVKSIRPEAIVLGDSHVGDHDLTVLEQQKQMIRELRPKRIVIHDLFNGHSINPHEKGKNIIRGIKHANQRHDLRQEIQASIDYLNELLAVMPDDAEIIIVRSNHDLWLDDVWLEDGEYKKDPVNISIGTFLANAKLNFGVENALEYAIKEASVDPLVLKNGILERPLDSPDRVKFLDKGDPYFVGPEARPVALGYHGHKGANGAKGGLMSFVKGIGRAVIGHFHSPARHGHVVIVGTSTYLEVGYNKDGMSSWAQTSALVGPNGEIQNLVFIRSEFFSREPARDKDFFPESYPKLHEIDLERGKAQHLDQWGQSTK